MSGITVPATVPHSSTDCQHLRDALQGFSLGKIGAEERKIVEILAHRDINTRRDICQMYTLLYKEDLAQRLNIELTKKLQKAMLWWVLDPAERDAQLAREALQGWNAKYRIIIEIACCRNSDELINIRRAYHALYKKSLEEDIAWEITGSVQKVLQQNCRLLSTKRSEKSDRRRCRSIAIILSTGEESLERWDVLLLLLLLAAISQLAHLVPASSKKIAATIKASSSPSSSSPQKLSQDPQKLNPWLRLQSTTNKELVSQQIAAREKLPPPQNQLLLGLVTAYRYGGHEVDKNIAEKEAEQLFEACQNKSGKSSYVINGDTFIRILSTRSFSHLNETIEFFKQTYGRDINQVLKGVETGEFEEALRMTIKCINRPARHFSKVLHVALKEEEMDEEAVTRVMTSRAEIDMLHIKTEYARKYHNSLEFQVKAKTVGNYKIFLLKLMGLNITDRN